MVKLRLKRGDYAQTDILERVDQNTGIAKMIDVLIELDERLSKLEGGAKIE